MEMFARRLDVMIAVVACCMEGQAMLAYYPDRLVKAIDTLNKATVSANLPVVELSLRLFFSIVALHGQEPVPSLQPLPFRWMVVDEAPRLSLPVHSLKLPPLIFFSNPFPPLSSPLCSLSL